jgi:hypothetical protein
MKRLLILIVLASAMFSAVATAASAKFTAVYNSEDPSSYKIAEAGSCADTAALCDALGLDPANEANSFMATIKMPQGKELLVGLSAQVGLFTETIVKGKRGSYSRALAFAEGGVELHACNEAGEGPVCYMAEPGYVTLSNRTQELEAILAGVIESCDVDITLIDTNGDGIPDDATGEFTLADCEVLDEMIGLGLTTLAAHHFNFLFPDLPQGDWGIWAVFKTQTSAEAEAGCAYPEYADTLGCVEDGEDASGSASARAKAFIGKYMMTVQGVRAVKDDNWGQPEVEVE